jgi:hypothetical protein
MERTQPTRGSWLARDGVPPANPSLPTATQFKCGSGLARESYLSGARDLGSEYLFSHERCSQAPA